jgi:hypothetical protein
MGTNILVDTNSFVVIEDEQSEDDFNNSDWGL